MHRDSIYQEIHIPTYFERFMHNYRSNTFAMMGLWCLAFILVLTLLSAWITPHDPQELTDLLLLPPSWDSKGDVVYFFGTDDLGRDIFSRIIDGSRYTFGYAVIITIIATLIGSAIGIAAGMTQGFFSSTLNHLLDAVMSIPSLFLSIIFVAFLGFGEFVILFAICLLLIPRFIHALSSAIRTEIKKDYVMADRLDGTSNAYLLVNSILPNIVSVLVAEITLALSIAILDITALGFLGLGAQTPSTEWGSMAGNSAKLIYLAPWTVILPGLIILLTVVIINIVGYSARKALDEGMNNGTA